MAVRHKDHETWGSVPSGNPILDDVRQGSAANFLRLVPGLPKPKKR